MNPETTHPETTDPEDIHPDTPFETASRLGKIARLPAAIRQKLNARLEDHEPGPQLLAWLNALPEVKKVLKQLFEGRPITEQNLSAWKHGGFRDWQRHQQVRARAHEFLEEGRELAEEVAAPGAGGSLLDRVGDRMALTLLELFREAEAGERGPERTRSLLAIAREVARLRRGDHERQQTELAQQRWQHERDLTLCEVRAHEEEKRCAAVDAVCAEGRELRAELIRGLASLEMVPERGEWICQFFSEHEELFREHGIPSLPQGEQLGRELAAERRKPEYLLRRYEEKLEKEAATKEAAAKEPATQGRSRPVKAAQGKSRSKNSPVEAAEPKMAAGR